MNHNAPAFPNPLGHTKGGIPRKRMTPEQRVMRIKLRIALRKARYDKNISPSVPYQEFVDKHGFYPPASWTKWSTSREKVFEEWTYAKYLLYLRDFCPPGELGRTWRLYLTHMEFGPDTSLVNFPRVRRELQLAPGENLEEAYRQAVATVHANQNFHREVLANG